MADCCKIRHSSLTNSHCPSASVDTRTFSKSDVNITKPYGNTEINDSDILLIQNSCEEYYKRYEYDEIPVKQHSSNDNSYKEDRMSGDTKDSLTNTDLENNLELIVLKKRYHDLQTEGTSTESLDSNIKLFKSTVQEIFDKFYNSMKDYEVYKQKYNQILSKKNDSVMEMEDFIKNMIQHILSASDTSVANKNITDICKDSQPEELTEDALQFFKNESYSNQTADDSSNCTGNFKNEETLNIYLLSVAPYVAIKMNNRSQLSEINIKDSNIDELEGQLASAENIKKVAAKKRQLEKYIKHHHAQINDRNIPIKVSNPKKDISLNEDFVNESQEDKSLISKICNYICKRFRKASLV